jgi:hypothetical protein
MNYEKELKEKEGLIEKLYKDIKIMHQALSGVTTERNEAVDRFSESERIWKGKNGKLHAEKESLLKVNKNIKADSEEMLI